MLGLVFPQRAHRVSTGGAAASAASARMVARVTQPQGSALALQGGRDWPVSWVSGGVSVALGNRLWHKLVLFWTGFSSRGWG